MKNEKARAVWVGILLLYVFMVGTVVALDVSLDWGFVLGLKILAVIHILLILGIMTAFGLTRRED